MEVDWSKVMKPYPGRKITLPNGEEMVVKEQTKEEIEKVADALINNLTYHKDLFDLVTSEIITELYLWRESRPMWGCPAESHFNLVGRVGDEIVGVTNGALKDPKTGNSLHTTTLKRGLQIGAYLWPCKDGKLRGLLYARENENDKRVSGWRGTVGSWSGDWQVKAYFGREWRSNFGDVRQSVYFSHNNKGIPFR